MLFEIIDNLLHKNRKVENYFQKIMIKIDNSYIARSH